LNFSVAIIKYVTAGVVSPQGTAEIH